VDDAQADGAPGSLQDVNPVMPPQLSRLYGWFQKMLDDNLIQEDNYDSFIRAACAALAPWSLPLWLPGAIQVSIQIHEWRMISAALEQISGPETGSE
jgi:hypothetical protein